MADIKFQEDEDSAKVFSLFVEKRRYLPPKFEIVFYFTFLKMHLLRFVISFLCSVFWICTYSYIMVNFF